MRVVLDTNVLIDAASDDFSPEARLLAAVQQGKMTALVTPAIRREYGRLIERLVGDKGERQKIIAFVETMTDVTPAPVPQVVIDDPEDKKFIEAAVGGGAELIVTHDRHLLDLGEIDQSRIVTPAEAWRFFEEASPGGGEWQAWAKGLGISFVVIPFLIAAIALPLPLLAAEEAGSAEASRRAQEQEIADLTQQITDLEQKKNVVTEEADVINNQVALIARRLTRARLELEATEQSLTKVIQEKKQTEHSVTELEESIDTQKKHLRGLIRLLYAKEQTSFIDVWLSANSLSEVLAEHQAVQTLQDESVTLMQQLQEQAAELKQKEVLLAQQQDDLAATSRVLDAQRSTLDEQKKEQAEFLAAKKEEQLRYEQKIVEAKAARQEIEAGLFALENSGVRLSFTSATEMAEYASSLTGVRPSLLLAVLKIESNLGTSIGTGTFPDDMQPASREPFLRIAKSLGRDPASMPISRAVSYGWGGAMGPAQIMPQTWEGIQPRLAVLLKKALPDPYDMTDAFVATALILSDKGASSPAGEREAVGRYLAGPNWQNFPWYVERVFAVAEEYAKEGLR